MKRKIIKIDEKKCDGCALCIPNCPEGALQIINGKARLISDLFCDGLGACIGHCPKGAITIQDREAEKYNEKKVMVNIVKQGSDVIKAHLEHLKEHNEKEYLHQAISFLKGKGIQVSMLNKKSSCHDSDSYSCPGMKVLNLRETSTPSKTTKENLSQLKQWPIQITLVPSNAPYFDKADLLIAADCTPFAYSNFHYDILKDKVLLIGCPKLDDAEFYKDKISNILQMNDIKSVTCTHMEVPCCFGLIQIVKSAIDTSGKSIPLHKITVGINGKIVARV